MQDDEVMFETWWHSTNMGIHSTSETIAKNAWHARDAEVDALKAEREKLNGDLTAIFDETQRMKRDWAEHERLAVAEALKRAQAKFDDWLGRQPIDFEPASTPVFTDADSRLLDERIAAERNSLLSAIFLRLSQREPFYGAWDEPKNVIDDVVDELRTAAQPKGVA